MTKVYFDIETIPAQHGENSYENFLIREIQDFKAPSSLTKAKACEDLGLTGNDAKFTAKDDAIRQWEKRFGEEKAPEVAEEKWRKTSFDGSCGQIISMAWAVANGDIRSINCEAGAGEKEMLIQFFDELSKDLIGRPPFFIGHYVAEFDLKFLFHRCVINGVKPSVVLPFNGRHDKDFYCTLRGWAGFGGKISQDNLCKALGIEGKPGDIDGSKVWDFVKSGDIKRVAEYNRDDVKKVREIYKKLNFINC